MEASKSVVRTLPQTRESEEIKEYFTTHNGGEFAYGVNDFPPFVRNRGADRGFLPDLVESVFADLGLKPAPRECDWSNFLDRLNKRVIFSLAAPMMPIHKGPYDIVDMFQLGCCAALYSKVVGPVKQKNRADRFAEVTQCFKDLRDVHQADKRDSGETNALRGALDRLVKEFGGWAACKPFFEFEILRSWISQDMSVNLAGQIPANAAVKAAKRGQLVVIDLNTLHQLGLSDGKRLKDLEWRPLFGEYIYVDAGPIFQGTGEAQQALHLAQYFANCWKRDVAGCRTRATQRIGDWLDKANAVDDAPFRIKEPDDVQVVRSGNNTPEQYFLGIERKVAESAEVVPIARTQEVGTTRHRYRLRGGHQVKVTGNLATLGYLQGTGNSEKAAREDLDMTFHEEFQRLWRMLPHDRSDEDLKNWEQMMDLVDLHDYERRNSPPQIVMGHVTERRRGFLSLQIVNDLPNPPVEWSLNDLPPGAAAAVAGEGFTARRQRSSEGMQMIWTDWKIVQPLRDDEGVWDDFEKRRNPEGG